MPAEYDRTIRVKGASQRVHWEDGWVLVCHNGREVASRLSLTASTTMARVFTEGRGQALSVSGLGYPLGEGLLPMAIVLLIHAACLGLGALSLGTSLWIAFVYLALAGVSQGIASPMMTALWAEVYGIETLGATKSMASMLGIFATALSPALLGGLLKAGVTFNVIIPTAAILGVGVVGVSFFARRLLLSGSPSDPVAAR